MLVFTATTLLPWENLGTVQGLLLNDLSQKVRSGPRAGTSQQGDSMLVLREQETSLQAWALKVPDSQEEPDGVPGVGVFVVMVEFVKSPNQMPQFHSQHLGLVM